MTAAHRQKKREKSRQKEAGLGKRGKRNNTGNGRTGWDEGEKKLMEKDQNRKTERREGRK